MKYKAFIIVGSFLSALVASGAVITTESHSGSVFTVSNTDLLETSSTGYADTLTWRYNDPGDPDFLADGDGDIISSPTFVFIRSGTIIYDLDTVASSQGYDITSIDTYSAHTDGGRSDQKYTVSYSTVTDPGTFITIATIDHTGNGLYEKWSITEDDSGIVATGVAKIQFDFYSTNVQQNTGAGYWELDVIGTAIPEPGTCALIGGLLALGSVMIRRRR